MAGTVKTVDQHEEVPAVDYSDPFPGIQSTLDLILQALIGRPSDAEGVFDITAQGLQTFGTHQWQRLQVSAIVASASAAGTLTLTVGSFLRTINIGAGVTVIPFPITIERGTDVILGGTAAAVAAFLIGTPE
jgi:hypothetical protein